MSSERGEISIGEGTNSTNAETTRYTVTASANPNYAYDGYTLTYEDGTTKRVFVEEAAPAYRIGADQSSGQAKRTSLADYTVVIDQNAEITCHFVPYSLDDLEFDAVSLYAAQASNTFTFGARNPNILPSAQPVLTVAAGEPVYVNVSAVVDGVLPYQRDYTLQVYAGAEAEGEPLLNITNGSFTGNSWDVFPRYDDGELCRLHLGFYLSKVPDAEALTAVLGWQGTAKIFQIPLASNNDPYVNELRAIYEDYMDHEKYPECTPFHYYMGIVYDQESTKLVEMEDGAEKEAAFQAAKERLEGASYGKGANAAVWQFHTKTTSALTRDPILFALPSELDLGSSPGLASAHMGMEAALEARYPKNWTIRGVMGSFGAFIMDVTAGGPLDVGKSVLPPGTGGNDTYALWYRNNQYSNYGVSNVIVYDGDVMVWGNPDQHLTWNKAVLNYYFGVDGWSDAELESKYHVTSSSTINELNAAKIPVPASRNARDMNGNLETYADFTRYGRWRVTEGYEETMRLIRDIGSVAPTDECGAAIEAAEGSYARLSEEDKKKVTNYDDLTNARAAYDALMSSDTKLEVNLQQGLDNTLASLQKITDPKVSSTKGEWAVLAIARHGIKDWAGFDTYLSNLNATLAKGDEKGSELDPRGDTPTEYARVILALTALGYDASAYQANGKTYDLTYNLQNVENLKAQGINAVAYALIALDSLPYLQDSSDGATIRRLCLQYLVTNQCSGGGWSYDGGTTDPDMTGMVLQALAPYYTEKRTSAVDVKSAVDSALTKLASLHQTAGGFMSMGEYNSESCAQVIVALCALGKDPATWDTESGKRDVLTALLTFYDSTDTTDGAGFKHNPSGSRDQMATEQAAYALVAYDRFENGSTPLYDMSDIAKNVQDGNQAELEKVLAAVETALEGWEARLPDSASMTTASMTTWLNNQLKDVDWGSVAHTVAVNVKTPVNGTKDTPEGTDGYVEFAVNVTCGSGSTAVSGSVEKQTDLPAVKWQSAETGVQSVTVCGVAAVISGTNITVTLPGDSEVTAEKIVIVPVDETATVGEITGSGDTWDFTVTAANRTDTANYTITITFTPTGPTLEDNQAAVAGARSKVESAFSGWSGLPNPVSPDAVKAWADAKLAELGLGDVQADVSVTTANPAVDGTAGTPDGTSGKVEFTVTLTAGSGDTLATDSVTFTKELPAQQYVSGDTGITSVTVLGKQVNFTGTSGTVTLPAGTDVNSISAANFNVTLSDSGNSKYEVTDSGSNWTITVTAQNGSKTIYTVMLTVEQKPVVPSDAENVEEAKNVLEAWNDKDLPAGIVTADNADSGVSAITSWLNSLLANFTLEKTINITGYTEPQPGAPGSYSADVIFTIQKTTTPVVTPKIPDEPNAPNVPETPGADELPGASDEPGADDFVTPNEPQTPDAPETPDVSDIPDAPPEESGDEDTFAPDDGETSDEVPDGSHDEETPDVSPVVEDTTEDVPQQEAQAEPQILSAGYGEETRGEETVTTETVTVHITGTIPALPVILSGDTGVRSITYKGTPLTQSGDTFTLQLASGETAPADGSAFIIVCMASGAIASTPEVTDTGWKFTVTAQNGDTKLYTIKVVTAPVGPATPSSDVSVSSVIYNDTALDKSGNTFTLQLSDGMATPTTGSEFTINLADTKASFSVPASNGAGIWSFTVTAEDGKKTATYTIVVKEASVTPPTPGGSSDASVSSITYNGVELTKGISNFKLQLTSGMAAPSQGSDFIITCTDSKATHSIPERNATGWSFTVTAENGETKDYTITVSNAPSGPTEAEREAAVQAAAAKVRALTGWDADMAAANSEDTLKTFISTKLAGAGLGDVNWNISVICTPAAAGTASTSAGTPGSYTATVTLSSGSHSTEVPISGKINPIAYKAPPVVEDIVVYFTLLGDTVHDSSTVHTLSGGGLQVWIPEQTVKATTNSTVGDVFKQVLDAKGYTYVGLESNYIKSITNPDKGITLAEKQNSKDSGWMYTVGTNATDGTHPNKGLNAYKLNDGDYIVWHYTDDYTKEEGRFDPIDPVDPVVPSSNANVSSVTCNGAALTQSGTTFTLQLTSGMTAPTSGSAFVITCADSKAAASVPVAAGDGVWSFTVKAENGDTVSYTIKVVPAPVDPDKPGPGETVDPNTKDEADKNVAGGEDNEPIQSLKPVEPVTDTSTETVKVEDAAEIKVNPVTGTITAEIDPEKIAGAVTDVTVEDENKSAIIVIDASTDDVTSADAGKISGADVTLPAKALDALSNAVQDADNPAEKVALVTNAGTVILTGDALQTIRSDRRVQQEDGATLRITNVFAAKPSEKEKFEDANISHLFDVKIVSKSAGAEVKVSGLKKPITITFQIGTYLNTKDFTPKIVYVGGGKQEVLPNNYYNPVTGVISAETTHLSEFAVTAKPVSAPQPDTTLYGDALKNVLDHLGRKVTNPTVNSTSGEWAVLALARAGALPENTKQMYLANLADYAQSCNGKLDTTPGQYSHTEYSRVILALTAVGLDASNFRGYDFVKPLFDSSFQQVSEQGNNGTIWALIALDSGNYRNDADGSQARAAWINRLASEQMPNGGWPISDADRTADLDTTAMAVQALAPYYTGKRTLPANVSGTVVRRMVDSALSFLSGQQNASGSFGSSEADAQIVVMLSALGRDAASDAAFTKNGTSVLTALLSYRDAATGGFCHKQDSTVDQMATEQAAYALVAYDRYQRKDSHTLYDMTDAFSAPVVSDKHIITATYSTGGILDPYGSVEVEDGGTSAFTFRAESGYELSYLLVDDRTADYVYVDNQRTYLDENAHITYGQYVFENVTSNHTIRAVFARTSTIPDFGAVVGKVSISIENRTYSGGAFYGTLVSGTYDLCQQDTMMTSVLKALAQNGYTWTGTGGTSADAYDITYLAHIKKDGKDLGEFTGGSGSGWMGTLNDWFTNESFQSFRVGGRGTYALEDGDEIHVVYTTNLGADVGGGRGNPDTSLRSLSITGGTLSPSFSAGNVDYTLTVPDTGASVYVTSSAANKNFLVKTFLNSYNSDSAYYKRGKRISVKPGDTIYVGVGDSSWPSMYDSGSYTGTIYTIRVTGTSLQSRINALPKADEITYKNYTGIIKLVEQLRADYTKLSDAEKARLDITRLTAAEERIKYFSAVDNVKVQLNAIPSAASLTETQAGSILAQVRAAYAAYNALDNGQKDCFTATDAQKYNAAVEWLEKLGYTTDGLILAVRTDDNNTSPSVTPLPFTDVSGHWAADGIRFAYERGLMTGVSAVSFNPEGEMSRAMFVTVLYRMENEPEAPAATYSDVPANTWYTDAVAWATANGIVNGTGNNQYSPDLSITRDEMATMMLRYAKFKGYDITATADLSGYLDNAQIPDWAYRAMQWTNGIGLITGRTANTLAPQGTSTRAETATILMRFLQRFAPNA